MASSGTVGRTVIDVSTMLEHAIRRAGKKTSDLTAEVADIALGNLFLTLLGLSNRGINLWCIDEMLLPVLPGYSQNAVAIGTIDILNANYRVTTLVTGTDSSPSALIRQTQFSGEQKVVNIGYDTTTTGTTTLVVETSPDGATWSTRKTLPATDVTAGIRTWIAVDGPGAVYWRVRETALAATLITALTFVSEGNDTPISRMSKDTFATLPNKASIGRPVQFWYDRQVSPVMHVWQVPDESMADNIYQVYRHRQVQDIGYLTNTLDVPSRWLEALIWELAHNLAIELPDVPPERINLTGEKRLEFRENAELEERDNSPIRLAPNIGPYTR